MNTFIETLSLMKRLPPLREFRLASPGMLPTGSESQRFSGQQTNEPQTKYYIWKLAQAGQLLDRIIVIVSGECMNDRIPELGDRTSYEFYHDAILQYLDSLRTENAFFASQLSEQFGGNAATYLDAVLKPIMIPERMESAEWRSIVDLICEKKESDRLKLYFDFTGGSRVANLISLLLLRVIEESKDASVCQVIYSDLQDPNDPKLVDCTNNYSILTSLERIAVASTGEEKVTKIVDELIRMGLEDEKAREGTEEADAVRNKAKSAIRKEEKEEAGKAAAAVSKNNSGSNGLAAGFINQASEEAKKDIKKSVFTSLVQRRDEALIKDFHEEIMGPLLDVNVLCFHEKNCKKSPKDRLKELIKANSDYAESCWTWWENNPKTGESERVTYSVGVYPQLRRCLEALAMDSSLSPTTVLRQLSDVMRADYRNAVEHRFYRYSPSGFSLRNTKNFVDYLQAQDFDKTKFSYVDLTKIQSVYYNLGFPFVCSTYSELLWDISNYYMREAEAFVDRLEKLRNSDPESYKKRLNTLLTEPGQLESEVHFMVRMRQWSVNEKRLLSKPEREAFLKTLCERIEKVRPYRNAFSHNSNNPFRDPAAQKAIAKEIRTWLKEYEERFCVKN